MPSVEVFFVSNLKEVLRFPVPFRGARVRGLHLKIMTAFALFRMGVQEPRSQ